MAKRHDDDFEDDELESKRAKSAKASRRHDADDFEEEEPKAESETALGSWLQYGLPMFLKRNYQYIVLILAMCLLGWSIWNWYDRKHRAEIAAAWNDLAAADTPVAIEAVVAQHDVKAVQAQALLKKGEWYLDYLISPPQTPPGVTPLRYTRDEALSNAQKEYERVLAEFNDDVLMTGAAHSGLATVAENRGDWKAVEEQYTILTKEPYAGTAFAELAQEKLKKLPELKAAPHLADAAASAPAPSTRGASVGLPGDVPMPNLNGPGGFGPPAPGMAPGGPSPFGPGMDFLPPPASAPAQSQPATRP